MATKSEIKSVIEQVERLGLRLSQVDDSLKPAVKAYFDSRNINGQSRYGLNKALAAALRTADDYDVKPTVVRGNCPRCGGLGYIEAYRHIDGGTCFECGGTKNV